MVEPPPSIAAYLAELRGALCLPPKQAQRVLIEVAGHLEDATAQLTADGLAPQAAERQAVERFGTPQALARSLEPARRILAEEAVRAACLAALGLLAFIAAAGGGLLGDPIGAAPLLLALSPLLSFPLGVALRRHEQRRRVAGRPVPSWLTTWNGAGLEVVLRVSVLGAVAFFALMELAAAGMPPGIVFGMLSAILAALLLGALLMLAARHRSGAGRRLTLPQPGQVRRLTILGAALAAAYAAVVAGALAARGEPWPAVIAWPAGILALFLLGSWLTRRWLWPRNH